jgi:hypothetical protein
VGAAAGLLLAVSAATTGVAQADATIVTPVTWSLDQQAKVIRAELHLLLIPTCEPEETGEEVDILNPTRCRLSDDIAAAVEANIEKVWNGHAYRCYDVVVDAIVRVSNDPRQTTGTDELIVRIDQSTAGFRSRVLGFGTPGSAWNSNDPADRLQPGNDAAEMSTWAYPPMGEANANRYAHEAGHAMGLEDGYEDSVDAEGDTVSRIRSDAPEDIMSSQRNSNVDPRTMALLVERSNQIFPDDIECDYRIDTLVGWWHFTAEKCETAEGDWELEVDGEFPLAGGARLVLTGAGEVTLTDVDGVLEGPWDAAYRIDVVGIPVSVGGQKGTVSGDGSLSGDLMSLLARTAEGEFWSKNPYASLDGAADNPAKDLTLPVENGAFC